MHKRVGDCDTIGCPICRAASNLIEYPIRPSGDALIGVTRSHYDELRELFMDLLGQSCGNYNREKEIMEYDHMCLSAYERGLRFAIEMGWINESQLTRGI